ncbi:PGM [Symbiodinium pilosum]|uniref:PGM protein n=1 Tax=Symbiodinium pilosum TaxID=2952 RepID=A0A812K0T2_SYMPI|nr:PGM [Symbiodinium pilosum]
MSRALMTSNIAFAHKIGEIPFIAHELCKEKSHGNSCDFRRSASDAKQDFPNVDFSLVAEEDPLLATLHHESDMEVAQRAYDFMLWLRNRTETEIVVSTHSAWLFSLFNAVLKCDDPELSEWFQNGEMRSVAVDFE